MVRKSLWIFRKYFHFIWCMGKYIYIYIFLSFFKMDQPKWQIMTIDVCWFCLTFVCWFLWLCYNVKDEIAAATSVTFNLDGTRIYCGFNKMVRVFDTARPGRECQERPTMGEYCRLIGWWITITKAGMCLTVVKIFHMKDHYSTHKLHLETCECSHLSHQMNVQASF